MKVASLFCGCGGLDYGFEKAGFDTVFRILPIEKKCSFC